MAECEGARPISLFYSYSHQDEALRLRLQRHLAALRRAELISEWHDRNIEAGDEWAKAIDRNLATADIILLLISADFIDSEYCWSVEMTKALERHDKGEAKVIPVILRPCRGGSRRLPSFGRCRRMGWPSPAGLTKTRRSRTSLGGSSVWSTSCGRGGLRQSRRNGRLTRLGSESRSTLDGTQKRKGDCRRNMASVLMARSWGTRLMI